MHFPLPERDPFWAAPLTGSYRLSQDYDPARGKLFDLYHRAKTKQWDAAVGLDWSSPPQEDNPLGTADQQFVLYGSELWSRLDGAARDLTRRHYTAWRLSRIRLM
jgi:hypothetical protein